MGETLIINCLAHTLSAQPNDKRCVRSVTVQLLSRSLRFWVLGMQGGRKVAKTAQGEPVYEMKRHINNICLFIKSAVSFTEKDPKRGCHIHLHLT